MVSDARNILYSLQNDLSKNNIMTLIDKYDSHIVSFVLMKFPGYENIYQQALFELKQKRNQQNMRNQIILRDHVCVLSNSHHDCCDIAHIKSFSNCNDTDEQYDISNGILLRKDLHHLFDLHLWTIHPDSKKVILSDKCKNQFSYGMLEYENKIINVDIGKQYLNFRYNEFMKMQIL
jgi:hypothetical protein